MQPKSDEPATASPAGLSTEEARARLALEGPNELASEKSATFFRSMLDVVAEPMFLLLLGAGALYLVLGSLSDALTLLAFVVVMIGLTLYQKRKTERAVSLLKDLSAPLARVLRNGEECAVPTREIVRGDLVFLREGDRVPADASVVTCTNLRVDESLLTGESVAVDKLPSLGDAPLPPPGSDGQSAVYGGTLVVQGRGLCSVRATGSASAIGRIGVALSATKLEPSALKLEVDQIVRRIALIGAALCVCLVLAYGITQGDYLRGLLAGITLAMAILPEEFPVVLTVFTTLGAFRIAKHQVLARRAETIESLGSATVLCVDKTGTITENRMRIAQLWTVGEVSFDMPADDSCTLPEEVHEVLEYGVLSSQPDSADPMEHAFHKLGQHALAGTEHLHRDYTREQEYPLTRSLLAVSHLFRTANTSGHVVAAKGAPEAIADLCHLDAAGTARVLAHAAELGRSGLRVLAVARADYAPAEHPVNPHDFEFRLLGLVGLEDPVRASVPAAVADFRRAFVRVIMVTGDHVETALAIAKKAGLDVAGGVVTGATLAALSESELARTVKTVNVFARCIPEHKLLLVRSLQSAGEMVAMTGDGVNDAPALKAAQIGVAIGLRGTDVAREAAALVLTTEDFGAIAQAIVLGRRIFENLRKAMSFVLAVHVPIAGMALAPVLLGWR